MQEPTPVQVADASRAAATLSAKKLPAQQKDKKVSSLANIGLKKEKDYFMENLTMLMDAGMDLVYALDALSKETKSKQMQKLIMTMREDILAGSALWRAMDRVRLLPPQLLYLVKLGEETGRLSENLSVIVMQQEKNKIFRSKIRSAMIYPILVISLTLIVGTGIAWFILPRLTSVFTQLDLDLPLITRLIIGLGDFLSRKGYIVVPIAFSVLIALMYIIFFFSKTRFMGQWILMHLPVIKRLIRSVELARFGFVLGTLLETGLPITRALASLRESTSSYAYQRFFEFIRVNVAEGQSFRFTFSQYKKSNKLMSPHIQQMIAAGEQSGSLPKTLFKIGKKYENEMEEITRNLAVLIEPFLLLIVWAGVLTLALAVIMPIYSLIGNINGQG